MKILILSSASIALKKTNELIKIFSENNHEVKVALTDNALKMNLVKLDHNYVADDDFKNLTTKHIELAKWADKIIVYPATFNTINKFANGITDNFVLSILSIGFFNKIYVCPAMNYRMFDNLILQENINKLKKLGVSFIGPEFGQLYCGEEGYGRVSEPYDVLNFFNKENKKKLLITIGYTEVKLDDVRTVSVRSSGKMGLSLINELKNTFDLTVINSNLPELNKYINNDIKIINVSTVDEYFEAVKNSIESQDIYLSVAAVSDLIFDKFDGKIKKDLEFQFTYKIGVDVLKWVSENYPNKVRIGFALESQNVLENGLKKLKNKNLNMIIVNNKETLKSNLSSGYIITNNSQIEFNNLSKSELAKKIVREIKDEIK
ncbi:bifunctional phosphopantothenoylcysteine decarboxylase/phosphopantothenate--cysteine ligase CoaBC [Mycoplasmopsis anatis]|uniref:Coenzyme A biosynthesis bifunctional protein CoaBC n=1 Tax=Mycoplasmopsis anatis TaxID=171279 RepID=A0A9Q3QDJ8_9BACT|nr:bifunctional phosphopantothenoylcysteine decarboxylase/phosphopantothenate--cysteine ligase CoaBC [Mycoplasmopsis anatis]MBW0594478.1 bifunctional phosphopantothenoylcysteine decarboxylase/phosphopantothenate--cysteine ligase CoaBC [Mycoplasmopsis anatis]MBW0595215.1 bifunctional phosphopantothenoylcysteine decarboxylase/phosphopantothenate--cysteine ligase CoaBC [Mycoplasmopsis anatis]MBW0596388.1 bifunctional phosphopantothenoylcysteine decarboxylase/phosphopantothenate--cysteine ligase Coa